VDEALESERNEEKEKSEKENDLVKEKEIERSI